MAAALPRSGVEQDRAEVARQRRLVRVLAVDVDSASATSRNCWTVTGEQCRPGHANDVAVQHRGAAGACPPYPVPAGATSAEGILQVEFGALTSAFATGAHRTGIGAFAEDEGQRVDSRIDTAGSRRSASQLAQEFEFETVNQNRRGWS